MRPVLALAILLLGLGNAAPEPEYPALMADYLQQPGAAVQPFVEIESSIGRSDRLPLFVLRTAAAADEQTADDQAADDPPANEQVAISRFMNTQAAPPRNLVVLASADPDAGLHREPDSADVADDEEPLTMNDLCTTVLTSARDNDLPVQFFANLLWQESGLRNDIVSSKGAQGIAQFMPEVAAETGLADPFDPMQAIPASARLLRSLKAQFSNLGYAAAAYNAGPHRVAQWLFKHRRLPRETQNYVSIITGKTAEQWRKSPPAEDGLKFFRRLPCRNMPEFAALEEQQRAQQETATDESPAVSEHAAPEHVASHKHVRPHAKHLDKTRTAASPSIRHGGKKAAGGRHEADEHPAATPDKRKPA
jgi:Transglycosylase SLT domain